MPDCSVDAVVTDPPYGLSFMGKKWDYDVPGVEVWAECFRVLKPGGHLLCFAGTRTQHRMAVRIEDAGFEIRDMIAWVYGSGFPKSLDVSKAIDKMDAAQEQQARRYRFTEWVRSTGVTARKINDATGTEMGNHYTTHPTQPAIMTREHLEACRHLLGKIPEWVEREADIRSVESKNFAEREVVGQHRRTAGEPNVPIAACVSNKNDGWFDITAPATPEAKQWQGWGTALKPALEPITVARKPLIGTVAENVLQHGTGAINVDGGRVGKREKEQFIGAKNGTVNSYGNYFYEKSKTPLPDGRWPANFIHDGSEEVTDLLGSAARFFYCAKASKRDRDEGLDCIEIITIFAVWEKEEKIARLLVNMDTLQPKVTVEYTAKNKNGLEWSTLLFGKIFTEQFHSECKSITSTASNLITESKTLNVLAHYITKGYIAGVNLEQTDGGSHAENAAKSSTLILTTNEKTALALGVENAVLPTQLKINASAGQNIHSTVKPTDLMRYLCRLVTPPDGTVLDPFMGSGSTGKAAALEGFSFIGIEREAEYVAIAQARINHVTND